MSSVAVLQARTTSTRLPGKVLLPVGGIPLAVLAGLRAGNTGRPVVLATSSEASDDALAAAALKYGLACHRGSLQSPLQRMVDSLAGYPDRTVVFRLTGDNVFPDGALLDELEQAFLDGGQGYLCCNGEQSGLPYGLSAEVFWLEGLRWTLTQSPSAHDHEHVTPMLRRKHGERYFQRYRDAGWSAGRCTVDCLDDYLLVTRVFAQVQDPVGVSWKTLCQHLLADPQTPAIRALLHKLVLGTVQLGMPYGINNGSGMPSIEQACAIIRGAIRHGVACIDTARAYGHSEAVVGAALADGWAGRAKVITKLSPLAELPEGSPSAVVAAAVRASVFESCQKLGVARLDVLMLHRAEHLRACNGRVWAELLELVRAGVVAELGVSVQNPAELEQALEQADVAYVQLPLNLLDGRWDALLPRIERARAERGLTVHVRSALLQGLLVSADDSQWQRAHVAVPAQVRGQLLEWSGRFGRDGVADLCLAYVRGLAWVDGVCLGMETLAQLHDNARLFQHAALQPEQIQAIALERPLLDEQTLNPASWQRERP
ncbi:aldo/keto reductase [Pseudomonas sp. SWRI51]|uniref:aldo/keto reductase n=1 Tax=Pseudomonas sp. SWRI51 TaxID=2745491 RepID=UPI001643FD8C|nr:aldo/keto reductase [Pseudomonas sp. SWRI51]MBC3410853.1 aldo/keto reductase [Pseudomonas sp. SWRI51]